METFNPLSIPVWRARLIILVLAFAAYAPTLNVGFLWDDHAIIENNRYIQHWTWDALRHDFMADNTQGQGDNYYRPFQAFSHRIDYSLWGLHPWGYHFSDVIVHVANGLLIYQLVMLLGFSPLVALMAACLFVVNPIGIEQFLVSSGRTTPLSFFFSLASILLVCHSGWVSVFGALMCFVLAVLTKEIGVMTPALIALVFYVRRTWKRAWIFLPMALFLGFYFVLRQRAVHYVVGPLDPSLVVFFMLKVFPRILWHYVFLIMIPWNLHSHRLIPHMSVLWPFSLLSWVAVLAWALWKRQKTVLFCIGWMVLWLLPTVPVMIRGSFMLDHWGYALALSVLLPLAIGFAQAWLNGSPTLRRISPALFLTVIIAWSFLSHLNVALRGTDEKMYRWALYFTTSNPIKYNLGLVLLETGRPQEAACYFEEVRTHYPEDANNAKALSRAYWASGHPKTAIRLLNDFVKRYPQDPSARLLLEHMKTASKP